MLVRSIILSILILAVLPLVLVVTFGSMFSSAVAEDLRTQCERVIGPDPASTLTPVATESSVTSSASGLSPSSILPTGNPLASITFAPNDMQVSDWMRACETAMHYAPRQPEPQKVRNVGHAAECAGTMARSLTGRSDVIDRRTEPAALVALVIRRASVSTVVRNCGFQDSDFPLGQNVPVAGDKRSESVCPPSTGNVTIVLPETIAVQSYCGLQVDPVALSPGDLVFWDYRNYAPTRVGLAIDSTEIVSDDPATGEVVRLSLPGGRDVRIKRVLGGG